MTETGVKLAVAAKHGKQCRKKGAVNKEITDYYGVKGELSSSCVPYHMCADCLDTS